MQPTPVLLSQLLQLPLFSTLVDKAGLHPPSPLHLIAFCFFIASFFRSSFYFCSLQSFGFCSQGSLLLLILGIKLQPSLDSEDLQLVLYINSALQKRLFSVLSIVTCPPRTPCLRVYPPIRVVLQVCRPNNDARSWWTIIGLRTIVSSLRCFTSACSTEEASHTLVRIHGLFRCLLRTVEALRTIESSPGSCPSTTDLAICTRRRHSDISHAFLFACATSWALHTSHVIRYTSFIRESPFRTL